MNYSSHRHNSSTVTLRVACAIVFMLFSFLWLYRFQNDMIAAAQHVLSGGLTVFHPLATAIVVTVLLQLLQLLVSTVMPRTRLFHVMSYLPSMLLLAMLTDIGFDERQQLAVCPWWWVAPLVLTLWLGVLFLLRRSGQKERELLADGSVLRPFWVNLLLMSLMMLGVVALSNTNAVMHYRMSIETALLEGNYREAADIGRKSLESDEVLTMQRAYALSRSGKLAERLFCYPVVGSSATLLPTDSSVCFVRYPSDSLYRWLGGRPARRMQPLRYLELLQRKAFSQRVADYQLCALLVDKRLDEFVTLLQHYRQHYGLYTGKKADDANSDRLPLHYREALTLYRHMRAHPKMVYHNEVMEENWANLQELERAYSLPSDRQQHVRDEFGNTYWYYYKYNEGRD